MYRVLCDRSSQHITPIVRASPTTVPTTAPAITPVDTPLERSWARLEPFVWSGETEMVMAEAGADGFASRVVVAVELPSNWELTVEWIDVVLADPVRPVVVVVLGERILPEQNVMSNPEFSLPAAQENWAAAFSD